MDEQTLCETFKYKLKYKLKPTSEQARAMAFILRRCVEVYNAALQERRDSWQKSG
jgi:hypothetical protein